MDLTREGWEKDVDWRYGEDAANVIQIAVLDGSGDVKKIWDKNNPDQVEDARRSFNYLVKEKRYLAFKVVDRDGDRGDQIRKFDPDAERMILVPPLAGG